MSDRSWDIQTAITSVYDADGFLGIQVDAYGSESTGTATGAASVPQPGTGGVADYEALHPGVAYRPMDATLDEAGNVHAGQGCPTLTLTEGGRSFAIPLLDPRTVALLPTVNKGDRILPADNGSFVRVQGSGPGAGRISQWTTDDGTSTGQSVSSLTWPDRFQKTAWWGKWTFDPTGYHVSTAGGARLDMGGVSGLPGPISTLGSYASLQAAMIALNATALTLGAGPAHFPAMRYDPAFLAWVGQIQTALIAITTAMSGFTGTGGFPGLPAAQAAIQTITPPLSGSTSVAIT